MRKKVKPQESERSELIEKPDGTDESRDNSEPTGQVDLPADQVVPADQVDPANQVDPPWLERKKQKGWFSWGIFAFAALFATSVTLVNAWVGPDEHYSDCALYHHHESEHDREERLLKLHLRLRRAEVLQNRDAIQMASWELARAVRETDPQKEAVLLRECIATQSGHIFPYDQARLDLCNVYLRLKRYEEAKEVIDAGGNIQRARTGSGSGPFPFTKQPRRYMSTRAIKTQLPSLPPWRRRIECCPRLVAVAKLILLCGSKAVTRFSPETIRMPGSASKK